MADQPIKQNPILNGFNKFFSILFQLGDTAAVMFAQTNLPFLKWPIISAIFQDGAKYLANQASVATQQVVDKIILDIHKNGDQAAVVQAAKKLKADGGSNADDIQKLADAEANAVSYPGSGSFSKF